MNLIINDTCNRSCPYCFARGKVASPGSPARPDKNDISLDNFEKYLQFHIRSHIPQLKLLGGEPTLHPEFLEFLRRAHSHDLQTTVFTNGLWPRSVMAGIRDIPLAEWRIKFLFNVNEPRLQPASQLQHALECMKIAGPRGQCGFNIYRTDFDLQFIPPLIDAAGMDRELRLGLAAPIVATENEFVDPGVFKSIGRRLISQLRMLEQQNVLGSFDCGFPLCMFPEEDLGSLTLNSRGFNSVCGFPIDVGPNLNAWACFPLSNIANVPISNFTNALELGEYFTRKFSGVRALGALDDCLACKYLQRKQCNGGCVALTLRKIVSDGDSHILRKIDAVSV